MSDKERGCACELVQRRQEVCVCSNILCHQEQAWHGLLYGPIR